ncbi:MAG: SRPBCC domain-containing protein [Chloroflexi bacterium]|nr:SRPBCC domain-containing protein [Chloroflexota bacterium]
MTESIEASEVFPVGRETLYNAWLSSEQHSAMTGSAAEIDARPGGRFTAWDGYISGTTTELQPPGRIVQSWRTTDFPEDAPDSRLEVCLETTKEGTRMTLKHAGIPAGQGAEYEQGWKDFYFEPMKEYFANPVSRSAPK